MSGWWLAAPWILFEIWWIARSRSTARTQERESRWSRAGYLLLLLAGFALVARGVPLGPRDGWLARELGRRLWPTPPVVEASGLGVECVGIAFAIWAREHLGRYWSGTITLKDGHRLITTGPYRIVRHPIYTGALVGIAGVVVAEGELRGPLGLLLIVASLLRKITLEERLLSRHFGDEYERFRGEVKALLPFLL